MNLSSQFQNEPIGVPGPSVNICDRNKSRKRDLGWLGIGNLGAVGQVGKGRHQPATFLPPGLCKRKAPTTFTAELGGKECGATREGRKVQRSSWPLGGSRTADLDSLRKPSPWELTCPQVLVCP